MMISTGHMKIKATVIVLCHPVTIIPNPRCKALGLGLHKSNAIFNFNNFN